MLGGDAGRGAGVVAAAGGCAEALTAGAVVGMLWPNRYGSMSEVATQGACSLLVACDTAMRVRLNISSAVRLGTRISRTNSVTSTLFEPLRSGTTLPGTAA